MVDVHDLSADLDLGFSEDFAVRAEGLEVLRGRIRSAPISAVNALEVFQPTADVYQQRVIDERSRTVRLLAPAGSGKTQTMINRILTRVREGVAPDRILLLTFDRSAAGSLEGALTANVRAIERDHGQSLGLNGLTISTLNAFGYRLLREFAPGETLNIADARLQHRLLRQSREELRVKSYERYSLLPEVLQRRYYLDFFSFLKNQLHDPRRPDAQAVADIILNARQASAFFEDEPDEQEATAIIQAVIWLYMRYEQLFGQHDVMDYDDQKLRAFMVLMAVPEALRRLQGRYTEIVVDEFQDINKLDFELIKAVAEKSDLVITGDDDQAIYGFRGCSPDYIIDLQQHLGRAVTSHELSVNYRCPPNLVQHADQLIRHNQRRVMKHPIAYQTEPSAIHLAPTLSASLEAKSVTEFIQQSLYRNPDLTHETIAVLYRTNAQSLPIQIEFILDDVPYQVRDEDNILGNDSLKKLLAVLRTKVARQAGEPIAADDQALVIHAYFRFVDTQILHAIRRRATAGFDYLSPYGLEEIYSLIPKARGSQFADALEEALRARSLDDALDVLRRRFKGLRGMVGSLEDAMEQRMPLVELLDVAKDFRGDTAAFVQTLDRALAHAQETNAGRQEHGVSLLTYFKSKGRQWHTVILTSCNQGLIPHRKAPVEDERRLFYVALTRASSNLLISYVEHACDNKVQPSQFLYEAGLLRPS